LTSHDQQLLEEVYADWGRGDYSRSDYVHPEFELVFAPGFLEEGTFRGPAEAWRGWRNWLDQWDSWQYEVERYIDLPDGRIAALIDIRGVAKGTGIPLAFRSANVWTVEDGRVRAVRIYARREDMLRECGLDGA